MCGSSEEKRRPHDEQCQAHAASGVVVVAAHSGQGVAGERASALRENSTRRRAGLDVEFGGAFALNEAKRYPSIVAGTFPAQAYASIGVEVEELEAGERTRPASANEVPVD